MPAQIKEINLLPFDEFEKSRLGRFLKWALSFGRWIVILTELVVILCFLSRFKLDRDLTDLGEKIRQQQAVITSYGDLEKNFRNFQQRLDAIERLEEEQPSTAQLLDKITLLTPVDVSLTELTVEGQEMLIAGVALSEPGLGTFLRKLPELELEKTILEEVNKKETGEIEFALIARFSHGRR